MNFDYFTHVLAMSVAKISDRYWCYPIDVSIVRLQTLKVDYYRILTLKTF